MPEQTPIPPKPTVYVAMPCYDSVQRDCVISLVKMFSEFKNAQISTKFNIVKSSLVNHARNLATCGFLNSDCSHMLFIDADVEFEPEAIFRMLVTQKDIICTPYRIKLQDTTKVKYAVDYGDEKKIPVSPGEIVEVEQGPAGLMLIHRKVFEKLMKDYPEMKINFHGGLTQALDGRHMYNFWDTTFDSKKGIWKGEDLSFCDLARKAGFKIYANLASETIHYGTWGWKGKFGDTIKKI